MSIEIEIPRYTLIREIGSGGMAVVYLATQEGLDREVAVKVLRQSLSRGGEEFKRRFEHEGRMLAQLEHENIVKIYDIGFTDDSVYLVMEYLRGGTLTQKMKAGGLVFQDIIKICAQVGFALHFAHRKNIIHRDLKPSNIMFRDPVTPVLTDFGIARKIDMDMTLTETGMMIGTPQYMSPEQLQGKPVDPRSDIYSLGLMFYRLLTGNLPFQATDAIALAVQQIQQVPPPLPEELSELQPVMDLMLAKDPADRYPSTLDFCNHLRSISLTGEEYSTELSAATRVFSSASFKEVGSYPSSKTSHHGDTDGSSVSRTFSSIGTAFSKVFTQKKPRNLALGTILAVVIGVVVAIQLLSHGLTKQQLAEIEAELNSFNAFMVLEQIYEESSGRNATDSLKILLEKAPEYSEVKDAANELAKKYEDDAWTYYDERNWDEAIALVEKGLEFAQNNEGLTELEEKARGRIDARDLQLKINDLLGKGNLALADGRLLPGDDDGTGINAYDSFKEIRELSSPGENQDAEQGLSTIQTRIAQQTQEAWDRDSRDHAKQLALKGMQYFETSQMLLTLIEGIENEEAFEQEQREFEQLLALAQEQFNSGRIIEPPQGNALESFQKARDLRPDSPDVADGLEKIAAYYLEIAQFSLSQQDLQASLAAADNGLKAVSDHPELTSVQQSATEQLGATKRAILTEVQAARRLIASGLFIPGQPGMQENSDSAQAAFNRALELDPDNQDARDGLLNLPNQIDTAAGQFQREGKLERAKALLVAANTNYQDEGRYSTRIAILDSMMAERSTRQRLADRLESLDLLIASRPLSTDLIDRTVKTLRDIKGEFPDDVDVTRRGTEFIGMIEDETELISINGDDTGALALLDHALYQYPSNSQLLTARRGVEQRRQDRVEQRQQELIAMSGVLAVDATPWARVMEIRNSQQVLQDLPDATETPFILPLLEGDYTVTLAAADGGEQVELLARVKRQEVETIRFGDTQMNSKKYFERSGW